MSENWKLKRVVPGSTQSPYIKGTEAPNYYLVLQEDDRFILGFRPLAIAVPSIGTTPSNGVATRIRFVPKNKGDYTFFEKALSLLDFEKRDYGDGFVHFSMVSTSPAAQVQKLRTLLSVIG